MIVVVAIMKAQAGREQEMEDALRGMIPKVESEEGTLQYALHRARKDKGKFLFFEKYRDKDALNAHSATPYFAELFARIGPLLDGSPTIEIMEEIAAIPPKG
ncbi:MAG TPA: putative quinol monooxygenase [Deltaproteobacteria bacterium]|nr:putative quinol monooxygenase [Deltaproteobacteria bacterium]